MTTLDHPTLLTRLIDAGTFALALRTSADPDEIANLCEQVAQAEKKPADGVRVLDEGTLLYAQALKLTDRALRRYERRKAASFGRVVAVLLPEIREALSEAIEQRKRPTP